MKNLFVFFALLIALTITIQAGVLDENLVRAMEQNPNGKFAVIAFFSQHLTPPQVMEQLNLRGDEEMARSEVVRTYQTTHETAFFWLKKFLDQQEGVENLTLHVLAQAATFTAPAKVIHAVADQPEIAKVALFKTELVKPDDYFVTNEYFQIRNVEIICNGQMAEAPVASTTMDASREITPDQIINILKQLYEFVKENKPVVNTSIDQASAVPSGTTSWQQLAGWREAHSGQYSIIYKNLYGIEVCKIVTRAHFYHSGNYQGVGRYITCATISIDEMNVMWGYTLNASVSIPNSGIVNVGTHDNPVAGMKMFVHWVLTTILQHQEGTMTYSLDGNGNLSVF